MILRKKSIKNWLKENLNTKPSGFPIKNKSELKTFSVGERVFHEKFGYGIISTLESDKATVDFEKSDQKSRESQG